MDAARGAGPVDRLALLTPANVRHRSGGTRYNHAVAEHAAALGHRVDVVPVAGHWPRPDRQAPGRVLAAATGYRRVLVDGLIGARCPEALTALTRRGVRTGLLIHLPERHGGTAQARALAAADVVVVTSAWTGRWLLAHAWPLTGRPATDLTARLVIARPGADSGATTAPDEQSAPATAVPGVAAVPRIACVAALTPNKNQVTLLRALAGLVDTRWSAELVGSTAADPAYTARVRDAAAPLADRVRLTGERDGDGLAERWPDLDLLVLPSTWESWGMVVTEALRHGVPAVVGGGTGAAEALRAARGSGPWPARGGDVAASPGASGRRSPGLPGAVVDAGDPAAVAAVLAHWLADPELRDRWRVAAAAAHPAGWGPATAAVLAAMLPALPPAAQRLRAGHRVRGDDDREDARGKRTR